MELTVPAALARAARNFGDAEAVAEPGGRRLTYRELHERVTAVSGALIEAGVGPGDRVAVWAPNGSEWLLIALGTLGAGAALVPVSTRFTGPEALDVIGRSGARALFVAGDFLGVDRLGELLRAAGPDGLERLGLVVQMPEELDVFLQAGSLAEARRRAAEVRPGDVSDIMFTSGTTGRSKGAMTSHERSLGVARAWADCARLAQGDRYLVVNPFFHTFGYKAGILACLVSGAALVPQAVFDAGEAMRLVEAERITVLPGGADDLPDDPGSPGAGRPRPVQPAARRHRRGGRAGRAGRADAARTELRDRADRLRADRGGGGDDVPPGRSCRAGFHHVGAGCRRVRGENRPFG